MDHTTDVVVVGGGASGLLAAVTARRLGHDVVLVESAATLGGATVLDEGYLWLPGNDLMGQPGVPADATEEVDSYLAATLGRGSQDEEARRRAFARTAAVVARWLQTSRIGLDVVRELPDCAPTATGARPQGRTLQPRPVPLRLLGDLAERMRLPRPEGSGGSPLKALRSLADRFTGGGETVTGGAALVAELLRRAASSGVGLWLDTTMTDVVMTDGSVTGVVLQRDGETVELAATRGVILACGGFEANADLRGEHLPLPTDAAWTTGAPGNDGAALRVGERVGAALARLDEAWWTPVMLAEGAAHAVDAARSAPHGVIVDQAGDRFFNEAEPPVTAGRRFFERNRGMRAVPSFLIVDNRHRQAYRLGPWTAGSSPRTALDAGDLVKAQTLLDLAQALEADRAGLLGSVVAYNTLAGKGRDNDFKRGQSPWDKFWGDRTQRRNPCVAKVDKAPYWAVRLYPGDSGTKGGVVIDADGRVLRPGGDVVPGLWACGGAAATLFGSGQPGCGSALGGALVEAYRAVLSLSGQLERIDGATG